MAIENNEKKHRCLYLGGKIRLTVFSSGPKKAASLTAARRGAGPLQQVCVVIYWKEAQVWPRRALMRRVLSAPAP